jgi:hypothetical protein
MVWKSRTDRSELHCCAIRLLPKLANSVSLFVSDLAKWAQASSLAPELKAR